MRMISRRDFEESLHEDSVVGYGQVRIGKTKMEAADALDVKLFGPELSRSGPVAFA